MKLVEFSVTNYRSITTAHKIKLGDLTVLVGKNNEGKSNLLTALNVAMTVASSQKNGTEITDYYNRHKLYDWIIDFPLQLQGRRSGLESIFKLNFRLEADELDELQQIIKTHGNEDIPLEIRIGKDNIPKVNVRKRGSSSYNKQSKKISAFISEKISFNYIQAIRTEDMALDVVNDTVFSELRKLKDNKDYAAAIDTMNRIEQGVLDRISNQLYDPLKAFLPNIKSVKVIREANRRYISRFNSYIDVIIDDGIATSISTKGDGIKNLVALALLKEKRNFSGASVIAIEEPESHLHSGAIHGLVDVIDNMSENSQVILSTHNPLFVRQNRISDNVIVDNGTARPAKNIGEIRSILGVLPSDNLENARFVLLVEGEDDKIALQKILPYYSDTIKNALKNNTLVIKPLLGASMLSHDLLDLKNSMCKFVVLLDKDDEGRKAVETAKSYGLLKDSEVRFTTVQGFKDAEFEDCIQPKIYKERLMLDYGIDLKTKEFKNSKKKWSDRVKDTFLSQGLVWNDTIEKKVKLAVAESIASYEGKVDNIVLKNISGFIDALVRITESMIMETR